LVDGYEGNEAPSNGSVVESSCLVIASDDVWAWISWQQFVDRNFHLRFRATACQSIGQQGKDMGFHFVHYPISGFMIRAGKQAIQELNLQD